jgi:hypothetical protein
MTFIGKEASTKNAAILKNKQLKPIILAGEEVSTKILR